MREMVFGPYTFGSLTDEDLTLSGTRIPLAA